MATAARNSHGFCAFGAMIAVELDGHRAGRPQSPRTKSWQWLRLTDRSVASIMEMKKLFVLGTGSRARVSA
jgi:hypothetical protein